MTKYHHRWGFHYGNGSVTMLEFTRSRLMDWLIYFVAKVLTYIWWPCHILTWLPLMNTGGRGGENSFFCYCMWGEGWGGYQNVFRRPGSPTGISKPSKTDGSIQWPEMYCYSNPRFPPGRLRRPCGPNHPPLVDCLLGMCFNPYSIFWSLSSSYMPLQISD